MKQSTPTPPRQAVLKRTTCSFELALMLTAAGLTPAAAQSMETLGVMGMVNRSMRDAQRAQAIRRIGATTEIEDVVGEVGADLDQQRHQHGRDEHGQVELMQAMQRRPCPDEHGHHRRGQGGGTGSEQPDA